VATFPENESSNAARATMQMSDCSSPSPNGKRRQDNPAHPHKQEFFRLGTEAIDRRQIQGLAPAEMWLRF
jgi:hypothetical protein